MTYPIYWTDPTKSEFIVTILEVIESEEGYKTVINKSIARPTGGGQDSDRGWILMQDTKGRFKSVLREDGKTVLVVDKRLREGSKANVLIDMSWRRCMMQNHTAEHLFMAEVLKMMPSLSLGKIWIDGEQGIVEIEGKGFTLDDALKAEKKVNAVIDASLAVTSDIVRASDLTDKIRAREGVLDMKENIRVIGITGFDQSACSGTHVKNTSEILNFKITDYKPTTSGVHLRFCTGRRAMDMLSHLYNGVLQRKDQFPFEMEQLGDVLDKCKRSLQKSSNLMDTLESVLISGWECEQLREIQFCSIYLHGFDSKRLKHIVQKLQGSGPIVNLLFVPGLKTNIVVWTNDIPVTAGKLVEEHIQELGGRGGGSDRIYTGGFSGVNDPISLYEILVGRIKQQIHNMLDNE